MKYAKLTDTGIIFAGKSLKNGGVIISNPSEQQYLAQGWKTYNEEYPLENQTENLSADGFGTPELELFLDRYDQTDTSITAVYSYRVVNREKTYSKLKILVALTETGYWSAVRQALKEKTVEGTDTTYLELWDAAQDFSSGNEYFKAAAEYLLEKTGMAKDDMIKLLEHCEA